MLSTLEPNLKIVILLPLESQSDCTVQLEALYATDLKPVQPQNALEPIEDTELGIVKEVNLLQNKKDWLPILLTEFGIVTDVKPLQSENALSPIEMTDSGIVTEVKPVQP